MEPGDSGGEGLRAVCIREVQQDLSQSSKALIEAKLQHFGLGEAHGFKVFRDRIEAPGDGLIIFKGMRDYTAESIKSLEGFKRAWWEEAQVASKSSLTMLRPTIRAEGSELWFSWNPRLKTDPVDMLFRGPERPSDAAVVRANWSDNPFFPSVLEKERQDCLRLTPDLYNHIWEGGYALALEGAYYTKELAAARSEGRICKVPHVGGEPVNTFWDIGHRDSAVIWFHQYIGMQHRFLRAYGASGEGPSHFAALLQRLSLEHGYVYGRHYLPHDAGHKTLASVEHPLGPSTADQLEGLGLRNVVIVERIEDVTVGINAMRAKFAQCWFDDVECERGLDALAAYRKEFDERHQVYRDKPLHDFSSDWADAIRQFAQGYEKDAGGTFSRKHRNRNARTA